MSPPGPFCHGHGDNLQNQKKHTAHKPGNIDQIYDIKYFLPFWEILEEPFCCRGQSETSKCRTKSRFTRTDTERSEPCWSRNAGRKVLPKPKSRGASANPPPMSPNTNWGSGAWTCWNSSICRKPSASMPALCWKNWEKRAVSAPAAGASRPAPPPPSG